MAVFDAAKHQEEATKTRLTRSWMAFFGCYKATRGSHESKAADLLMDGYL